MPKKGEQREGAHNQYRLDESAKDGLIRAIKRIEKMQDEKDEIAEDMREEYKQLKAMGYDATAIRSIIAERKAKRKDEEKWQDREDMKDLYRVATATLTL